MRILLLLNLLLMPCLLHAQPVPFSRAIWISPGYREDTVNRPCPVFFKPFLLTKTIKRATLHITALGLYEARFNGRKAGNAFFTPGFTSYNKRLQYQVYDVKGLLQKGNNMVQVTVADGWYRGVFGGLMKNNNYGEKAALLFRLRVDYEDGSRLDLFSDRSWRCGTGGIRAAGFYQGETQDTRIGNSGWTMAGALQNPEVNLVPAVAPPVVRQEVFYPRHIFRTSKNEQVIDFGQNMAGFVHLKIKGRAGDTVRVYHAEILDRKGNFYMGNLREALAADTYVLNGRLQDLEPHFTYHGFRYVKVTGFKATGRNCRAIALYTALPHTGSFSCSNPLVNQLQHNIQWSMNSNFVDIPTDCPQRSERLGWTGDAQVFCATAAFNRNVDLFYGKWLKDLAADQGKNGGLPNIIPDVYHHRDTLKGGVAGWGDAAIIIPWTLYMTYGNKGILQEQYDSMKKWAGYVQSRSREDLWTAKGYGDWYGPGDSTSVSYIDQCFYAHSLDLLVKTARVLKKNEDVRTYAALLQKVKAAFLKTYVMTGPDEATDTQTAYVLALAFDLLPDSLNATAAARLAALIHRNHNHLATGFLGTPYLLPVLSLYGYSGLAYTLLNQQTCPSWLYPVTRGATTIWEKWDAILPDSTVQATSFNHYAYGAVGQWLYENVAGIKAAAPGYKKVIIRPETGGGLTWAKGSYSSSCGLIKSEWRCRADRVEMDVTIPRGTTAIIYVPGKAPVKRGPGSYHFRGSRSL